MNFHLDSFDPQDGPEITDELIEALFAGRPLVREEWAGAEGVASLFAAATGPATADELAYRNWIVANATAMIAPRRHSKRSVLSKMLTAKAASLAAVAALGMGTAAAAATSAIPVLSSPAGTHTHVVPTTVPVHPTTGASTAPGSSAGSAARRSTSSGGSLTTAGTSASQAGSPSPLVTGASPAAGAATNSGTSTGSATVSGGSTGTGGSTVTSPPTTDQPPTTGPPTSAGTGNGNAQGQQGTGASGNHRTPPTTLPDPSSPRAGTRANAAAVAPILSPAP